MNICPPDHKHGQTGTCYTSHACRCDNCRTMQTKARYRRRQLKAYGVGIGDVPGIGVNRRVQALVARGWAYKTLERVSGINESMWKQWESRQVVERITHKRVSAIYEQLAMKEPPVETSRDRAAKTKATRRAERRGFLPPLAWDDIDHDAAPPVPDEVDVIDEMAIAASIDGLKPKLTPAEKVEAIRILNRAGWSDPEIAPHMGIHRETVLRLRKQAGITAAPSIYRAA